MASRRGGRQGFPLATPDVEARDLGLSPGSVARARGGWRAGAIKEKPPAQSGFGGAKDGSKEKSTRCQPSKDQKDPAPRL